MKERLLVSQLRDFIENDNEYSVALVAGIRRTGKTTILKQLQGYYRDAVYIDLSKTENGQEIIEDLFLDDPSSLLLLDEISYLEDYEQYTQMIYNLTAGEYNRKFKVIVTGSSVAHVAKLRSSKLGGGRAKFFRLPPLMFSEYLLFTGRISSYNEYDNVKSEDFADYLFLNGLESNLCIHFTDDYFSTFYDEVSVSNKHSCLSFSFTDLREDDLSHLANLLAYKLSEACDYDTTVRPQVGNQEHIHLYNLGLRIKKNQIDLSTSLIADSKAAAPGITISAIGRILHFMLYSGLANIEYLRIDPAVDVDGVGYVLNILQTCTTENELEDLFRRVSICMTSPLFYTRLGCDILSRKNVNPEMLKKGMIFGKMLELYVRGALASWSNNTIFTSHKLNYTDVGEVDVWDSKHLLLCEISGRNKDAREIHIQDYFKDAPFIRVCTSRDKEYFNKLYHQIPFAKFCCMIDTGDIFNLEKTVISYVLPK